MTEPKKYTEAIGRRKTAAARVRIAPAKKSSIIVNDRKLEEYFPVKQLEEMAKSALEGYEYAVTVKVVGGGISAQAEAIRHGISRAIIDMEPEKRGEFKAKGFLTRDQRSVERKKFGLKKARRSPQWSKR
jgi:small subunit ribosomal protein S9